MSQNQFTGNFSLYFNGLDQCCGSISYLLLLILKLKDHRRHQMHMLLRHRPATQLEMGRPLLIKLQLPLRLNPGAMASGKDVVLPCAVVACWMLASKEDLTY